MKVICIEEFEVSKYDDNGFVLENEYMNIEEGSIWEVSDSDVRYIDGEVRLTKCNETDAHVWIEIPKEWFEEYFHITVVWEENADGLVHKTEIAGFHIIVCKHHNKKDMWAMGCERIVSGIEVLDTTDLERAKFKALSLVMEKLHDYQKLIDSLGSYLACC